MHGGTRFQPETSGFKVHVCVNSYEIQSLSDKSKVESRDRCVEKYISGKITKKRVAPGEGDWEPGLGAEAFILTVGLF